MGVEVGGFASYLPTQRWRVCGQFCHLPFVNVVVWCIVVRCSVRTVAAARPNLLLRWRTVGAAVCRWRCLIARTSITLYYIVLFPPAWFGFGAVLLCRALL